MLGSEELVLEPWEVRKIIAIVALPAGVYRVVARDRRAWVRSVTVIR